MQTAHEAAALGFAIAITNCDRDAALAVCHPEQGGAPRYFIELGWADDGRLATIRDFRYVPYITRDGSIVLAG